MRIPLVLEIKGNSLDDGPGVRTVVFFKGCPLNCVWCHNPESKRPSAELSFSGGDCIDCGTCRKICDRGALSKSNRYYVDRTKCDLCFRCADACPAKALERVGEEWSVDALMRRILSDKIFYDVSGGGVTISGGEPTLCPEFAGELLAECAKNGVDTLVETCGFFDYDLFERHMLPHLNRIFFDLKLHDPALHRKYCGVSNEKILKNFARLVKETGERGISLLPRTPLIPDITDTDENLAATADFLAGLGVRESRLLPYNPTWYPKNAKLGIPDPPELSAAATWQSPEKMAHCRKIYADRGISV